MTHLPRRALTSAIPVVPAILLLALMALAAAASRAYLATGPSAGANARGAVSAIDSRAEDRGASPFTSYDVDPVRAPTPVAAKTGVADARGTFIVVFREPALAAYRGGVPGIAMPKRLSFPGGRQRLDARSPESRQYVSYLHGRQRVMEKRIAVANRAALPVRGRYQHALNAIVVDMTNAQAARVVRMPEVMLVEPYRSVTPDTDTGMALIGAPSVWSGSHPAANGAFRGEGMVLGSIDTGINFGSPSFAAIDPVDGYAHVNPLGTGNYLGTCAAGGADAGRCNNKLIGGYDMICLPPTSLCGQPNVVEDPGAGDTSGHGTHTASTAAGNHRNLVYGGHLRPIVGVAPRANIVAFDICYYDSSEQGTICPTTAIVAAFDKAVSDGLIDVINYSFSGSRTPWDDAIALAMLNAVSAGIMITTTAGNIGPDPGSVHHLEPWAATVAASTHGRGEFTVDFGLTGPNPLPAGTTSIRANESWGGTYLSAGFPANTPIRNSPTFNTTNDGCNAFLPNTFLNAIALVRAGTCSNTVKIANAAAVGAVAVVIANYYDYEYTPFTPGAVRPAIGITASQGTTLWSFVRTAISPTARIAFPLQIAINTPDAMGDFSARGPALGLDLIKPNLTAPGVSILAADAGPTVTGFESEVNVYTGTSMAAPHIAGSALLVRQARPGWTPPEVLSALMMTAHEQVVLEDNITPANPHARGSGRVRVDRAINAGLVLNEIQANFLAANPATGGNPAALNLPSMADATCAGGCSFTRTFRNTRTYGSLWRVQLVGLAGTAPALLWVPAGASASLTVTINSASLPANGSWNFGSLVLTELFTGARSDAGSELHLPIGVVVPAPPTAIAHTPQWRKTTAVDH
jgi:hypothetical protein